MFTLSLLRNQLKEELVTFVDSVEYSAPLKKALHYVLSHPGKLIRPLLANKVGALLGYDLVILQRPTLALELLHISTLIHDDLPIMDNDDYRRGMPTCHKVFGNSTALMLGNCLISVASRCIYESNLPEEQKFVLTKILLEVFEDICEGQVLDTCFLKKDADLCRISALKTGALFKFSLQFPVLSQSKQDIDLIEKLGIIGESLGILFQMIDDFKDLYGTEKEKGRAGSSDARNDRLTFFIPDHDRGVLALSSTFEAFDRKLTSLHDNWGVNLREGLKEIWGEAFSPLIVHQHTLPSSFVQVLTRFLQ